MAERDFRARHLAFPRFPAQLPRRFGKQKDAVHARVAIGQTAAIGIDRQAPARRDAPGCHEIAALALFAETKVFQGQKHIDGEGVVKLHYVDVFRRELGHGEAARAGFGGRADRQIGHGGNLPVLLRRRPAEEIDWLLLEITRAFRAHHHHGTGAVANKTAVTERQWVADHTRR